jgi:hypothetical protein
MLVTMSHQLPLFTGADATELIKELKASKQAENFLKAYPERDLETVINFINDPRKHFSAVREINDFGAHLGWCEWILIKTHRLHGSFLHEFVRRFFPIPDVTGVDILTFMSLNSWGSQAEELDGEYLRLFQSSPKVFIEYLEKRNDWRDVINHIIGSASEYVPIIEKLGDTEFEKQLKELVRVKYDLDNYHPPLTLEENSVLFLSISQKDMKSLELDKPETATAVKKSVADFEGQAKSLISNLRNLGFVAVSATGREVFFKDSSGNIIKMSIEINDLFGIALFRRGKAPMLVIGFESEQMAGILSEYLKIPLEKLRDKRDPKKNLRCLELGESVSPGHGK